jgi:hypothetical protein
MWARNTRDGVDSQDGYHKDRQDNRRMGSWIPRDEVEWHGLSLIKDERTPQDAVRNSFKMKCDSQDGYQSG